MIMRCKYCGELYDGSPVSRVTCGKYECQLAHRRDRHNAIRAKEKARFLKRNKDQLVRDAKAAKDLGVSYGVYMGLYKPMEVRV